jgi:hypothetical protein
MLQKPIQVQSGGQGADAGAPRNLQSGAENLKFPGQAAAGKVKAWRSGMEAARCGRTQFACPPGLPARLATAAPPPFRLGAE